MIRILDCDATATAAAQERRGPVQRPVDVDGAASARVAALESPAECLALDDPANTANGSPGGLAPGAAMPGSAIGHRHRRFQPAMAARHAPELLW
jgi:hypothetical protein